MAHLGVVVAHLGSGGGSLTGVVVAHSGSSGGKLRE
jgi:hypothetical protein